MAAESVPTAPHSSYSMRELMFAGDHVSLAGQIDYPARLTAQASFPLLFILPHAGCNGPQCHTHYARAALDSGYAVFRWDKRGTGRSGSGDYGLPENDALRAYETALAQQGVDQQKVVILAQNGSTALFGERYLDFVRLGRPIGAALTGNMLDEEQILAIDCPVHIITGERDWNYWSKFARDAVEAHNRRYGYQSSYYVARFATRHLTDSRNQSFHIGAEMSLRQWLEQLCPPSTSI